MSLSNGMFPPSSATIVSSSVASPDLSVSNLQNIKRSASGRGPASMIVPTYSNDNAPCSIFKYCIVFLFWFAFDLLLLLLLFRPCLCVGSPCISQSENSIENQVVDGRGSVWCFLMHSIPYVRIDTWEKNDQSCQTQKQKELTSTIRRSNPHASTATEQQIQVHIINGVTSFLPWLNTQQSWTSNLWLLAISSGPSQRNCSFIHRSAKRYGTITKILPFGMPRHVKSFKLIVPIVYCYDFQRLQNGRRPRTNIIQYLSCRIFHNTNADIGMIWFGYSRSFAE